MRPRDASVWRNGAFVRLWSARTVSILGSHVTGIALPLAAILELDASATEIGILVALAYLPPLVLSFVAGVVVDRRDRRGIMVASDVVQALVLASVPVAAVLDALTMGHLYAVAAAMGVVGLFFDIASFSYLPAIVGRSRLVEANSALTASSSAAAIAARESAERWCSC